MTPRLVSVMILFIFFMWPDRLPAQSYITEGDVPADRGFRAVTLLRGLEHPWSMAWLPNGDMLITEAPGATATGAGWPAGFRFDRWCGKGFRFWSGRTARR